MISEHILINTEKELNSEFKKFNSLQIDNVSQTIDMIAQKQKDNYNQIDELNSNTFVLQNEINLNKDAITDITNDSASINDSNDHIEESLRLEKDNLNNLILEEIELTDIFNCFRKKIESVEIEMEDDNTEILSIITKINDIQIDEKYEELENMKNSLSSFIYKNTDLKDNMKDMYHEIELYKQKLVNYILTTTLYAKRIKLLKKILYI